MTTEVARPRIETQQLRRRAALLGVQTGAVVAIVVLALVGTALVVVLRSQHATSVDLLQNAVARADDVRDPPDGVWLAILSSKGLSQTPGMPLGFPDRAAMAAVAASGTSISGIAEVGGKDYLVYTAPHVGSVVQGVRDLSADHAERARLISALAVSGLVGLLLAVLAGLFLAARAMRPIAATLALQRRFVADASHELRTPLTLLSTRAQLVQRDLRRGVDRRDIANEVDGLVVDANNLGLVLEDLLLAVDPREEALDQLVDLGDLALQVVDAQARADPGDLVQVVPGQVERAITISGAPTALRRALTAVIDNAVRHASTTVSVSVTGTATSGVLEVADDGPGIDPQMLPKLFERHQSTGGQRGGRRSYGLGLALVSDVVARHDGTISARNRDERASDNGRSGAVLVLTFPRAAAAGQFGTP